MTKESGTLDLHASRELLDAMAGLSPRDDVNPMGWRLGTKWSEIPCGAARGAAPACSSDLGSHRFLPPIECATCLTLMREARGGVRDDALQERESAAKSVLVNAEFDAERAAKSAEHAAVIEQARAIALGAA